jgi:chromosome segregation protein
MRLRKIKLAGFKSFVDPTTLTFPGDLIGIVGPNGCGKSNIIDAVMWVMGESSAKHLRGDALTDVIFNGSSGRKPVGQAAVELIFDNSDGRVGGQYANYSEISIKRQMTRDSLSLYFLNGARCRRRDITAIFLGTGLGPRSYSIIEQGMISRVIEAKPDELRHFIEEAAGISKYRERRRETELRIAHTRDNISRLNDIREELDKQLQHLHRQARAAERYQELKKEERRLEAELLALSWRVLRQRLAGQETEERTRANAVEAARAQLQHLDTALEKQRVAHADVLEAFNSAQSDYYQVGAEIAQLEQKIQHGRERAADLESSRAELRAQIERVTAERRADQEKLEALQAEMQQLAPQLEGSRSDSEEAYSGLNRAELAAQAWQNEWDACNAQLAEYARDEEAARIRREDLEFGLEDLARRRAHLEREIEELRQARGDGSLEELAAALRRAGEDYAASARAVADSQQAIQDLRQGLERLGAGLDQQRSELQIQRERIASLEAEQLAGQDREAVSAWLRAHGYAETPRLADVIEVDPEWSLALETVLGSRLEDLVLSEIDTVVRRFDALQSGASGALSGVVTAPRVKSSQPRLIDKIRTRLSLGSLLGGVYIAPTLEAALKLRPQLEAHESVITRDGLWLGPDWARIARPREASAGMLARHQEIGLLRASIKRAEATLAQRETEIADGRRQLLGREGELRALRDGLERQQERVAQLRSEHAAARARADQAEARQRRIEEELAYIADQIEADQREAEGLRRRLEDLARDRAKLAAQRERLAELRENHRRSLEEARDRWQRTHHFSHGIALKLESLTSQRASLQQADRRMEIQLDQLAARLGEIEEALATAGAPLPAMQRELEKRLGAKLAAEHHLQQVRGHVQEIENEQRRLEQERAECEQQIQITRQALEEARLAAQESRIRLQTVAEQIRTTGHEIEALLGALPETAESEQWQAQLDATRRKIERLGPINLAAIDEHAQLSERKTYLDRQYNDLAEGLNTLETAIRKIDRETRTRFKETFDRLNEQIGGLFPELFGGGHAYLELTGEDLLETGVTIMARPPGKRISTIHLLSGGEKALTAVALVFSIFRLNPAPFCILDEVDAPLDDVNVTRFGELLKRMSTDIQFIFVTHNKITMEVAQQLIGVTMQEPGVSRLVSVDVEEAVALAQAG